MIYLAIPYSHESDYVQDYRYRTVTMIAAAMMNHGAIVYSPITHCRPLAETGLVGHDWETWSNFDTAFIDLCEELFVVKARGWKESTGVQAEIEYAESRGVDVFYYSPDELMEQYGC